MSDINLFPFGPIHITATSHYDLGLSTSSIKEIVKRAKTIGSTRLGLMDNTLSGALEFSKECKSEGIKPIVGLRVQVLCKNLENQEAEPSLATVGLIALNDAGWTSLCRLFAESQRRLPKGYLLFGDLTKSIYSNGIALLTGPSGNSVGKWLTEQTEEWQKKILPYLKNHFKNNFYIEIDRPLRSDDHENIDARLIDLAYKYEIPICGTTDIRYHEKETHLRWSLINTDQKKEMVSVQRAKDEIDNFPETLYHMRDQEEILELFKDIPEAIIGNSLITEQVDLLLKARPPRLPSWPDIQPGETEESILRDKARAGLEDHLRNPFNNISQQDAQAYRDRLEFELDVIARMKFPGYFLMVYDFLNWAHKNDIPIGPGRGSGAGSIVAWSLGITKLNPLRYGLLFERFLNPDRVSMPDFDIDICVKNRGRVVDYIRDRYGASRVANIAAFGELKARGAFKMAARAVTNNTGDRLRHEDVNELSKTLVEEQQGNSSSIRDLILKSDEFNDALIQLNKTNQDLNNHGVTRIDNILKEVVDCSEIIQGIYNTASQHAAGLVISPEPLEDSVPLIRIKDDKGGSEDEAEGEHRENQEGNIICGYDMKYAEMWGLIKFDLLGLAAVTILQHAQDLIRLRVKDFNVDYIPLDDDATLAKFREGMTSGVFQFESDFMRAIMLDMQPTAFTDLAAANALGRPGPMQYIPQYCRRKRGEEHFDYYEPIDKTRPILEETYGIMVYQEQVMQIVQVCAGYSLAAADMMRRAMGKKDREIMEKNKKVFIEGDPDQNIPGALKMGLSRQQAERIYSDIATFAQYGFNKSHSVAYALIGYQTMWLKAHYPAEFMVASMSMAMEKSGDQRVDKLTTLIRECHDLGVKILPPDINESSGAFTLVSPNEIRFGLAIGANIRDPLPADFLTTRAERPFASIEDFHERCVKTKILKKNQIESLIALGAFDSIQPNRAMVATEIDVRNKIKPPKMPRATKKNPNPVMPEPEPVIIPDVPDWSDGAAREHKCCGMYVTRHPIDRVINRLQRAGVFEIEDIKAWMNHVGTDGVSNRRICAVPSRVMHRVARNGQGSKYIKLIMNGRRDIHNMVMFPSGDDGVYNENLRIIEESAAQHAPIIVNCAIDRRGGKILKVVRVNEYIPKIEERDTYEGILRCSDIDEAKMRVDGILDCLKPLRNDHDGDGVKIGITVDIDGKTWHQPLEGRYTMNAVFQHEVMPKFDETVTRPAEPPEWVRDMIVKGLWDPNSPATNHLAERQDEEDSNTITRRGFYRNGSRSGATAVRPNQHINSNTSQKSTPSQPSKSRFSGRPIQFEEHEMAPEEDVDYDMASGM